MMASQMPPPPVIGSSDRIIQLSNDEEAMLRGARCQNDQSEELLLNFERRHHAELDSAIKDGNPQNIILELNKARGQFPDATFNTALKCAIESDRPEIALLLMDNGIEPISANLLAAAARGQITVVERILLCISWPINEAIRGDTILTRAVRHSGLVEWLLRNGADPNVEDMHAETALSRAVECDSFDVVGQLLQAGADIGKGAPLHLALERDAIRSVELVKQLLVLGAPVDQFIGEGSQAWDITGFERGTPLHSACKKERVEVVQILLDYGADPTCNQRVKSLEIPQTSPLDVARRTGNTEIIAMLEKYVYRSRSKSNL